jgi:hypothetical protein
MHGRPAGDRGVRTDPYLRDASEFELDFEAA